MKNRTEKNVLRSSCGIFAAALLLVVAGATTTWAGYHNLAGTTCSAYNNNQANKLERSHVRLLNPATNTQSIWVICTPQRLSDDLVLTVNPIQGVVVGFWDTGITSSIDCIFREFNFSTIHVPGGAPDAANTINAVTVSIPAPVTTPGVTVGFFNPANDDTSGDNAWTFACKLPPGTGVNQIAVNQQ